MTEKRFIQAFHRWTGVMMHNWMIILTRYARQQGYSISQLMALNFIGRKESCGVTDLGEHLGVSSAAASQLLDRLVQQNLIIRTEDPNDRRGRMIALTTSGERVVAEMVQARHKWLGELHASLSPAEIEQTLTVLDLLTEKAGYPELTHFQE
jgi:DNA-binding MarR family transcriptional regulator